MKSVRTSFRRADVLVTSPVRAGRAARRAPRRAPVRGKAGARVELEVTHDQGRKHLPIVSLRRVA